jgi:hypothetical protein
MPLEGTPETVVNVPHLAQAGQLRSLTATVWLSDYRPFAARNPPASTQRESHWPNCDESVSSRTQSSMPVLNDCIEGADFSGGPIFRTPSRLACWRPDKECPT